MDSMASCLCIYSSYIHTSYCSYQNLYFLSILQPITSMVISPNLEIIATSSMDGYVKFWDINFEDTDNPR